jgi:membrane fusion protein (multidrug efflux system)
VVNVPELDVRWLTPGQPSLVMVDAYPEDQWVGEIVFVSLQADSATKTFEVWVELDNSDGRIRPGMMARAHFEQRLIQDAISVPLFSVVDRGGERIVFVETGGVARAVLPEFGVIEGDRVEVVSGLEPGDHLIVSGQTMVEEGVKVTVR